MKRLMCLCAMIVGASVAEARDAIPRCRTRFSLRRPTRKNALSILIGVDEVEFDDGRQSSISFNHGEVGLTRPISSDNPFPLCRGYQRNEKVLKQLGSRSSNGSDSGEATECNVSRVDGWRILLFHRRVGHGKKCYRRVQKAVLDWDFEACNGKKSMGIISVMQKKKPPLLTCVGDRLDAKELGYATPRRSLLATFSEICLPKRSVFVVNPVHTVYEVRDARWCTPNSILSATAYATCKGHLLAGEERVTVLWRRGAGGEVDVEIVSFSRAAPSLAGKLIRPLIGRMQKQFFLSEIDHLDKVAKGKT